MPTATPKQLESASQDHMFGLGLVMLGPVGIFLGTKDHRTQFYKDSDLQNNWEIDKLFLGAGCVKSPSKVLHFHGVSAGI
jgi:hypothetical protein